MLQENAMRLLQAPSELFEYSEIPPNYLIQNVDNFHFVVHRELTENEIDQTFPAHMIFEYERKTWIAVIATFRSEKDAEIAVHSYWNAIKQLNEGLEN